MNDSRLPKILLHAECAFGQRHVGQPEMNFRYCIKNDLQLFNIKDWEISIQDRKMWRSSIFQGKDYFLKNWWISWAKKYSPRHDNSKSKNKKSMKTNFREQTLNRIMKRR